MNLKKTLLSFFVLAQTQNTLSSSAVITQLKPTSGDAFIIMTNHGSNSSIQLGNKIIFGDGTNPITISANPTIITWPTIIGQNAILGINTNGQLITTEVFQLGTLASNSIISYPDQDITIQSNNNYNISLNATDSGNIKLASSNISLPSTNQVNIIGIDSSSNILSSNQNNFYLLGNSTSGNYLTVDNSNNTGIDINTSNTESNLSLNAGNGNIILSSGSINYPSTLGAYSILGIDLNGNVVTFSDNSSFKCGNLTATGTVSLGTYNSVTNAGNNLSIPTSGNIVMESGQGNNIIFRANGTTDMIKLYSSTINPSSQNGQNILLALDNNNNLTTSNNTQIYIFGSTKTNENYIQIDNETLTGIKINGEVALSNGGFILPTTGNTMLLSVDSTGKIGTIVSSSRYKENIEKINISEEEFQKLTPVSYNYIGSEKLEYGLIAEEVYKIESLQNLVIFQEKNIPLSINYLALSAINTAMIQKINLENKNKFQILENIYQLLINEIEKLKKNNTTLEEEIKKIKKSIRK